MVLVVDTDGKHEVLQPTSTVSEPDSCGVDDELTDAQLHEVAAAELAVDYEVEQRQVGDSTLALQVEANGPDLLWLRIPMIPDSDSD